MGDLYDVAESTEPGPQPDPPLMGWYDPNRKRSVHARVVASMQRFEDKFGVRPSKVVCNPADAEGLDADVLNVAIETQTFIPRHTFYIGPVS